MKKILSIILATVIATGVLSGCSKDGEKNALYNPDVEVKDAGGLKMPLTNSSDKIVWSVNSAQNNLNDSYVIKKLREMTGVNLEILALPFSTAAEKIKILAASNDLPDITGQGLEQSFADDLSMQGAFAAVSDYVDKLPNFKKVFVDNKDNDWIFKSYSAPDGKLYGFYGYDWNRDANTGVTMYRKDIFDKHGIKMWNSPETFYDALKKLKEIYPNSTPYTIKSGDGIFKTWSTSWGMVGQSPYYDESKKEWFFTDTDPKYKEMLDFMLKCYNDGLIDPEFLTNTQPAWTAKMTAKDKAFVTTDWIGRLEMFKEQTKDTVPEYDLRFANPIGPTQHLQTLSQLCWPRYVKKADKEREETCFKLLDFCMSPTGKELITMGVEGETYTLDENGMAIMKGFENERNVPGEKLEEKWGMRIEGMYLSYDRRCSYYCFSEREQEAQDFAKDKNNLEPADPILAFTKEEKEEVNKYLADLEKAGKEFATKYILNNGGEKEWNEWIKKAKGLGCDKLVKIYNEAQKRFDK